MQKNPSRTELFRKYKGDADVFIETGTYLGEGIRAALNAGFETVVSFEKNAELCEVVRKRYDNSKFSGNVTIINADTSGMTFFDEIFRYKSRKVLFWLDAHRMGAGGIVGEDYPLTREISAINRIFMTSTVLMDDVRLFERYGTSPEEIMSHFSQSNLCYCFSFDTAKSRYPEDVMVAKI